MKKRRHGLIWLVLPLLAVNLYACWRLNELAKSWSISLMDSWSDGLTQLAVIIALNTAALLLLAAHR